MNETLAQNQSKHNNRNGISNWIQTIFFRFPNTNLMLRTIGLVIFFTFMAYQMGIAQEVNDYIQMVSTFGLDEFVVSILLPPLSNCFGVILLYKFRIDVAI